MSKKKNNKKPTGSIRPLTFGDIVGNNLRIRVDEAAIIVLDKAKASLALVDPSVNPFEAAFVGSPELIAKKKAKYENDPRYDVTFYPAEK